MRAENISDYFDIGDQIYIYVYLRDGAQSNGTTNPTVNFSHLVVNTPSRASINLINSDLELKNSALANNYIAIKADSSDLDIQNCNFIDNNQYGIAVRGTTAVLDEINHSNFWENGLGCGGYNENC